MLQNTKLESYQALVISKNWLNSLNAALNSGEMVLLGDLFLKDGEWRDLVALSGKIETHCGNDVLAARFLLASQRAGASNFIVDTDRTAPRNEERGGRRVIEAIIRFDTVLGPGEGVIRLFQENRTAPYRAWSLMTGLAYLNAVSALQSAPENDSYGLGGKLDAPNWLDLRSRTKTFANRDPAVLVVGGGHAGLCAAVWLGHLGIDTLVVDTMTRIGDNWRKRYHNLKLHNERDSNHMPFLPFPKNWPRYIAKDKIANWLESYVEIMEINFWTETRLESARYIKAGNYWEADLTLADGSQRTMSPRHIVMATSVSGTPRLPNIPTLNRFKGTCMHSRDFGNGKDWKDRNVLVFGTGTSAHDIAQNLHENGALVTMVQRSPTLVVSVSPGAQMYDSILLTDGPPLEDRDLYNVGTPLEQMKVSHRLLTDRVRKLDKKLLDGLSGAGFRLDFGENGTGWPLKYRTRGGGYYFNIGCSDYIISGEIGLIQYDDIRTFTSLGVTMQDGTNYLADMVVLATGYYGQEMSVREIFGEKVADRIGPIWGFGSGNELRNMWTATAHPGIWFTSGSFSQCRAFSKYMAFQIAMELQNLNIGGTMDNV